MGIIGLSADEWNIEEKKDHDFSFRTVLVFLRGLLGASVHSEIFLLRARMVLGLSLFLLWSKFFILSSCSRAAFCICRISFSAPLSGSSIDEVKRSINVLMLWLVEGKSFSKD